MTALTNPTLHVFSLLEGTWALDRTISNHGTFKGRAWFQKEPSNFLLYTEVGVFTLLGCNNRIKGTRSYQYRMEDDILAIKFADPYRQGQPYIDLAFKKEADELIAHAVHLCPPDTYNHTMTWISDTHFQTDIVVSGPNKDYTLSTRYQKTPLI